MSIAETFPGPDTWGHQWLPSPEIRRRAISYGLAFALHALAFIALITLPPVIVREAERAGQALDIRFYTVAGGPDADTDAPLFEPPLAGGETGTGPVGVDGGDGEGGTSAGSSDTVEDTAVDDPVEEVEPDVALDPEPVEASVPEVEPLPAPDSSPDTDTADASIVQTPVDAPAPARQPQARPVPPPPTSPPDLNQPVATAQPGPAIPEPARPAAPITFADIVARTESRLDPEDFRILANFAGGVTGTVRENFCMSSADANQEAFDCPEGSQLAAPNLARFGLMGLGEEPPEFLEDMDRLAFQLSQTGAGETAIGRILTSLREARRDAVNSPALTRQMDRDALGDADNLGVSNPFGEDGP